MKPRRVNICTKDGELKERKFIVTGSVKEIQMGEGSLYTVDAGIGACPGRREKDDRIWIPEHVVYNVKAVDSTGNLIVRSGSYGNAECDGVPGGRNPEPAIPITWPISAARHKNDLLIDDRIGVRIVRCRLEYRETKEIRLN